MGRMTYLLRTLGRVSSERQSLEMMISAARDLTASTLAGPTEQNLGVANLDAPTVFHIT